MTDRSDTGVMSSAAPPGYPSAQHETATGKPEPGSSALVAVSLLILCVPIGIYFWFIHHYAVNVIYWDQWSDIYVIQHPWFSSLWTQHGDHRLLFPNLLVTLLASWTHFNVVIEEYVSAAFLVLATGLILVAHKRRRPDTPWLYYLPLVLVMLSLDQVQTTLWGFQLAWCLVLLSFAITIYLLDTSNMNWAILSAAMLVTMVGSFSSFMGLFIWPAGLLLLFQRRRATRFLVSWSVAALVTGILYFHHFEFNQPGSGDNSSFGFHHPIVALKYLLFSLGGSVTPLTNTTLLIVIGLVLVLLSTFVLIASLRRDETSGRPIGATLVFFALLFAASTAVGRSNAGLFLASRYNTFYLLLLAGSYLALVQMPNRPTVKANPFQLAERAQPEDEELNVSFPNKPPPVRWRLSLGPETQPLRIVALGVVMLGILSEVFVGTPKGLDNARVWATQQNLVAAVTYNIDHTSDATIQSVGLYGHPTVVSFVRREARYARAMHLSLFATAETSAERRAGADAQVHVRMTLPAPGATVRGRIFVAAIATDELGVTVGAWFQITGANLAKPLVVGSGVRSSFGWLGGWSTEDVANGTYFVTCVVRDSSGLVSTSHRIAVRVAN